MYKRGKLADYKDEHLAAQIAAGWTQDEIENGKTSINGRGKLKPEVCKTTKIFDAIQNPEGGDDYIWESDSGTLSLEDAKSAGWFPNPELE